MTDKIANKKLRVIHPFLLGIYPAIFLYSRNVNEVSPLIVFVPTVIILVLTFIFMLGLRCLIKDKSKVGIILTGFWFYFFAYGNVYSKLEGFSVGGREVGTNLFVIPAWTVIFLFGVWVVLVFPKDISKLTRALNAVAICFVVMCVVAIGLKLIENAAIEKKVAVASYDAGFPDPSKVPSDLPDIYYIIPDRRLRSDLLEEFFGFDDSAFLEQLRARGFFVAEKSNSNYIQTRLSLATALHCVYHDELLAECRNKPLKTSLVNAIFQPNRVFNILKKCGYTMVSFESGYAPMEVRGFDVHYSIASPTGFSLDEYTTELISNTFIPKSLVGLGFSGGMTLQNHRNVVLHAFEKLGETATLPSPHFVYCHIISPHPPYLFDENGIIDRPDKAFRWGDSESIAIEERSRKYVAQLKYTNKRIIEAIDDILANSQKPPVIILQSDHGVPWGFGEDDKILDYRIHFGILNAYYLPDGDNSQLYESISPVNSFRVILNKYFGANLELLEDWSYYSSYEQPFDFEDKTEELKRSDGK